MYGQGVPLIILHGLFGSLDNWHSIAKTLASDFTVLSIDLRNHGKSPHNKTFNYETLRDDVIRFMEENRVKSSHILGHSLGGKVAMNVALSSPEKLEKLVVVDIAPKMYKAGHEAIFEALRTINLSNFFERKEVEDKLLSFVPDLRTRQFLMKGLIRNEMGKPVWKFNIESLAENYLNILKSINSEHPFQKESLFIAGSDSEYLIQNDMREIEKLFPKASFKSIENAGHWVHADRPGEFLKTVKSFLLD